jgi:phage-related protein
MWPWDWVISAGKYIAGVSQDVYNWVTSLIASVTSWVTDAIDSIWHTIETIGRELGSVWSHIAETVENAVSAVYGWIRHLVQDVYDWASRGLQDLWNWARGTWDWIVRQIAEVRNWIASGLQQIIDWVNREVWQPLVRLYNSLRDYASGWIARIWQYIEHPELLVELVGGYLLKMWLRYVARFGLSIARFILRQMMSLRGEVFDLIEHVLVSIL